MAQRTHEVFAAAQELAGQERAAFLDSSCAGNPDLRAEVEDLLRADEGAGEFLLDGADSIQAAPTLSEGPGTIIGRYKLLQQIGEGGFGVVFMAEQSHPVRRRVALKIIKLGMDTKQVVARFEVERQVLAMMDHPNIAKVFDAGSTETGRPYFVMELAKGVPITEFCDSNNLDPRERLALFVQVCDAVHHAHQKGVIHRDIKPSNVLVTLRDDLPVPKVIDFGIAKATNARLTERTLFTEFRQFIGTPEYVSPEQAQYSDLDVDTRSDVYSLGVLLYELLTGVTPFDGAALRRAGFAEIQRVIREDEPPKPSTRVSTLGADLTAVAKNRGVEPERLGAVMRGELDWIVMRALEKNRTRRYGSAHALAEDVRRHLDGEVVLASPPSRVYRARKAVQRHKAVFATAGALVLALTAGLATTAYGMAQAQRAKRSEAQGRAEAIAARDQIAIERDAAQKARDSEAAARTRAEEEAANSRAVTEFLRKMLGQIDPDTAPRDRLGARPRSDDPNRAAMLEWFAATPYVQPGELKVSELLRRAIPEIPSATAGQPLVEAEIRLIVAKALRSISRRDAEIQGGQAARIFGEMLGDEHPTTLRALIQAHDTPASVLIDALDTRMPAILRVLGPEDPDALTARTRVAHAGWLANFRPDAVGEARRLAADTERILGGQDPLTFRARMCLADRLLLDNRPGEARQALDQAFAGVPDDALRDGAYLEGRALATDVLYDLGDTESAIRSAREVYENSRRLYGSDGLNSKPRLLTLFSILTIEKRQEDARALVSQMGAAMYVSGSRSGAGDRVLEAANLADFGDVQTASTMMEEAIRRGASTERAFADVFGRYDTLSYVANDIIAKPSRRAVAEAVLPTVVELHEEALRERAPDDDLRLRLGDLRATILCAIGRRDEAIALWSDQFESLVAVAGWERAESYGAFRNILTAISDGHATHEQISLADTILARAAEKFAKAPETRIQWYNFAARRLQREAPHHPEVRRWAGELLEAAAPPSGQGAPKARTHLDTVAMIRLRCGEVAGALELEEQAMAPFADKPAPRAGAGYWTCRANLGLMLAAAGRDDEAIATLRPVCCMHRRNYDPSVWGFQDQRRECRERCGALADLLDRHGHNEEAARWRAVASAQ